MPFRLAPPVSRALRGVAAVAVLSAAAVTLPRAASADQQSSVQAQISALQAQLSTVGRQVHTLTFAYTAAQVNVASLAQQLQADQARAAQAAATVDRTDAALRQEVLQAYMGGFSGPSGLGGVVAGTTGGGIADPAVRYGYISIATSGVQDSLDSYRAARLQLNSALAAVASEQRAAQDAASSADRARQAALSEASQANAHLAGLETQLTALQQAAAARAALAAQRQRALPATPTGAARPAQTQGGPVNGGLVAVVRAQVDAPAAAAPAAAAPPTPPSTVAPSTSPPATSPPATAPPATVPAPPPPATVAPAPAAPTQPSGGVWLQLRTCESGNDYQANTGNGYYGAYQFSQQTWTDLGYPGRPDLEPPAMQDQAAQQLQAQSGWGQWPACAAALGLT
ncbi:MAG TPA: transglycosylase family protein [Acidimicrobiales bacterium]|nr:transglycosylase family protein [Acidimicrobiales bacterium]